MAGITLEQAEARLAQYMAAEEAVLAKQSYEIETPGGGRRKLTLADLDMIQAGVKLWDERAKALGSSADGFGRLRTVIAAN